MNNDMDQKEYTSIVLGEATKELEASTSPTEIVVGLIKAANILHLLNEYKSLSVEIIEHLDKQLAQRTSLNIFDYATRIQTVLRQQIAIQQSGYDN